jgi:hypothetical protein
MCHQMTQLNRFRVGALVGPYDWITVAPLALAPSAKQLQCQLVFVTPRHSGP